MRSACGIRLSGASGVLPGVLEVLFSHFCFEYFFDDRQESTPESARWSAAEHLQAGSSGEPRPARVRSQRRTRERRVIELNGQHAIWPAQIAAGSRRVAIGFENLAHVVFAARWLLIHGRLLSLADRAAMVRRSLWCGVMANTAQQRIDHGRVTKEVAHSS